MGPTNAADKKAPKPVIVQCSMCDYTTQDKRKMIKHSETHKFIIQVPK